MQKYHRGERRYQRQRMIRRVTRQERRWIFPGDTLNARTIYLRVTTRKLCSCYLCTHDRRRWMGNSRTFWPLHDLKQVASLQDWMQEATPEI